jgi:flagellar hook assembly protein FlgD
VVLKVYDATGRLVRTLDAGRLTSGSHSIEWDGRDTKGASVQPGVYFCRLLAGDETLNRKIVLIR